MKNTLRSLVSLSAIALLVAACASTGTGDGSAGADPSSAAAPSESPEESLDASPEPVGTLTVADGEGAIDGPGLTIDEALAGDVSQPVLVRGTLFLDTDGQLYLADSVTDSSAPEFGPLRLHVANYPADGPTWDMADADVTGLQEANGILFFEDTRLYGTISE
jgi:hypothetical protein